ncbi:MAG: hypothetical protein ACXABY_28405 [Candidatus Thorarchaeota archaeon]
MSFNTTLKFPKRYAPPVWYMLLDAVLWRGASYSSMFYLHGMDAWVLIGIALEVEVIMRVAPEMIREFLN